MANTPSPAAREWLAELSLGLTPKAATQAPKLFQLQRRFQQQYGPAGNMVLVKLLVIVLRAFVDSLRVPDKPDAADIMELADTVAQTYTHDSLKDIILALKEARTHGTKFYQSLDVAAIYKMLRDYFDRKARHLENQHLDRKAACLSNTHQALTQLQQATPHLVAGIGRQIPDDHPNADHLRQRLSLINQKQKRGLLSADKAEQLRAETQAATQRNARFDWQPNEAAQKSIEHRHRQAMRRFSDRHGIDPSHI
ncbi:hypothetical protein [Hymenobacter sp. CRA2]|uniref:hypothetical protein n=1 Tax=Hymenobacter sp. CRA2 TaxID=1955620 RepID=UPI0020CA010E|nr:hypothetical protein [Hymenobacter sp. CRA2]